MKNHWLRVRTSIQVGDVVVTDWGAKAVVWRVSYDKYSKTAVPYIWCKSFGKTTHYWKIPSCWPLVVIDTINST